MADRLRKSFQHRSLLTDTLPYEVPVIFSNDRFHASLSAPPTGALAQVIAHMNQKSPHYTIPYTYEITKDDRRRTTLSVVHPLSQLEMCRLYELHAGGMLSHCARGGFSLRRPTALASPFGRELKDEERDKSGIPQLLAEAGEADMAHLSSYFVYGKYNLLSKFISSAEYLRLEGRYGLLRRIDVSKCFYNIYTHSITWSVKSKPFAKEQRDTYSFESSFDRLMQRCNYNETNGIVVGPEFSRIFAEIILQDIDECVEHELREQRLFSGRHYDVRRYVDDYFVFARDAVTLDKIEDALRRHLERYKLYVNEDKVETQARPFVSPLTLARDEIAEKLREVSSSLAEMKSELDMDQLPRHVGAIRAKLRSIRFSVARYNIQFANISGWLMTRLRQIVRRAIKAMEEHAQPAGREFLADVAIIALEVSLYLCSIDLRVRTTYLLCQMALIFDRARGSFTPEQNDLVGHLITEQITSLVRSRMIAAGDSFGNEDDVELCNLLICGAHFVGGDFLTSQLAAEAFEKMVSARKLTYFNYITLAFCMRKVIDRFGESLQRAHDKARQRILEPGVDIRRDTEPYLFAVDYLASPEVSPAEKQSLFQMAFKKRDPIAFTTLAALGTHVGFADWSGVTVEHQLRRKELRPVYAWS